MDRVFYLAVLIIVIMSIQEAQGQDTSWAKRDDSGKEVVTNLQFYFHDTLSGNNPSAIPVVKPARTNTTSFTGFGSLTMVDDPLTTGPESTSKEVGRARGLYGSAGQNDFGLIMVMSYVFTDGIYDGSSFSLLSINPATNPVREMAIVGGTGLFRLARGYAIAQTYWLNPATGDAIVGYNVTISTYI